MDVTLKQLAAAVRRIPTEAHRGDIEAHDDPQYCTVAPMGAEAYASILLDDIAAQD
jgi:hypothetical protein